MRTVIRSCHSLIHIQPIKRIDYRGVRMQTCTTEWSLIPATVLLPSFDLIPGLTSPRRQVWDWVKGQECTYTVKFYIGSGVKGFYAQWGLRRSQCTNGGAPASPPKRESAVCRFCAGGAVAAERTNQQRVRPRVRARLLSVVFSLAPPYKDFPSSPLPQIFSSLPLPVRFSTYIFPPLLLFSLLLFSSLLLTLPASVPLREKP